MIINGEPTSLGSVIAAISASIHGCRGISEEYWIAPLDPVRRARNQQVGRRAIRLIKIPLWFTLVGCIVGAHFAAMHNCWVIFLGEPLAIPGAIAFLLKLAVAKEQERSGRNLLGLRIWKDVVTPPPEEAECEGWPTSIDDEIEPGGVLVKSCCRPRLT